MAKAPKRPRDTNQLAKFIADLSVGDAVDAPVAPETKDPAAVARGQLGGLKGGAARAAALTPTARAKIARKAAKSRWQRPPK